MARIDDPQLVGEVTDALGRKIAGRVLLSEQIFTGAIGNIDFDLSDQTFNRYIVEVDGWAATANDAFAIGRFEIQGAYRSEAEDYGYSARFQGTDIGVTDIEDRTSSRMQFMPDVSGGRFGNVDPSMTWDYTFTITPGNTVDLPRVRFEAWGCPDDFSSTDEYRTAYGWGMGQYSGITTGLSDRSGVAGRATGFRLLMDGDTTAKGTFRLYGTE